MDYRTLEEIRQRKNELRLQIDHDSQRINQLWSTLIVKPGQSTKGQFVASLLSHSALVIDAFLTFRKLRKNYAPLLASLRKKK